MNKVSFEVVILCAFVVMVFGSDDRNEHPEIRTVRCGRVARH